MKSTKVLMIVQYPQNVSPGQRFRFELYEELLSKNGFQVTTKSFLDKKGYDIIHEYGFLLAKFAAIIKGFLRRFKLLFTINRYDFIFLQREVAPIGPPIFEWLFSRIFKKKIIYDFDDAIWIEFTSKQNRLATILKNPGKVAKICKLSYKVSAGNRYLCRYAEQFSKSVVYNPTCVDTESKHNITANHNCERLTVGWTGSFSTMVYLSIVEKALSRLQEKYDFDIKIICNQQPNLNLKNVKFVQWTNDDEITQLASYQIGLMPLTNDVWNEGKCGFKLIQYFSLEIPAVASPIGVNKIIIEEGVNGFFASTDQEWYVAIETLLLDASLRKILGKAGRQKVINEYSLRSNSDNFLSLFS